MGNPSSGHGPTYMSSPHVYIGPFRCWLEALCTTRPLTWLSPCVWGDADGSGFIRNLLHRTILGSWIVKSFWAKLGSDCINSNNIAKHTETKKLVPDQSAFWYGVNLSILNYRQDIYDYVRSSQVQVIRKDVKGLEMGNRIRFEDGATVRTHTLVCCMGWSYVPSIEFRPKDLHAELGISSADYSRSQKDLWDELNTQADTEIFEKSPMLLDAPKIYQNLVGVQQDLPHISGKKIRSSDITPWRLFRGIAPPSIQSRDIVFLGMVQQLQSALRSEVSSIWAYAYLNNKLEEPLERSVVYRSRCSQVSRHRTRRLSLR